jgi:flagellin
MPIVVNSNASAISASYNLSRSNDALRASLEKLSSGKKINRSSDDAEDMAASYRLESDNRAKEITDDPASKYSAVTEKIADARAKQKLVPYATHNLERNYTNTSATYGRIVDTDNAHRK